MASTGDADTLGKPRQSREHFIATLPGILTGLAALLTAVGTVIGVLWGTGALGHKKSTASGPTKASDRSVVVTLPFRPVEGVASAVRISAMRNGPASLEIVGRPRIMWATFTFALLPKRDEVEVVWRDPRGRVSGRITKPAVRTITSYLRAPPGRRFGTGMWHAQLEVAGRVVKDAPFLVVPSAGEPDAEHGFPGEPPSRHVLQP